MMKHVIQVPAHGRKCVKKIQVNGNLLGLADGVEDPFQLRQLIDAKRKIDEMLPPRRVWNSSTTIKTYLSKENSNTPLTFSSDGSTLAFGDVSWNINLWDVKNKKSKGIIEAGGDDMTSLAFSSDNNILAAGCKNCKINLFYLRDGQTEKKTLQGHTEYNSNCICTHGWRYKSDPSCPVTGHAGVVTSVAFSPDNKTLASASEDMTIKLWDLSGDTPKMKATLTGHSGLVKSVAFSSDKKTLASASDDKTIKLWDLSEDTPKAKGTLRGHTQDNPECTCTHGRWISDYKANPSCPVTGHTYEVTSVAFSPDGKTLASGSWDKTVKLWDVGNMSCKVTKKSSLDRAVQCVTFSPDNKFLAFTCFRSTMISVWDVSRKSEAVCVPDVERMFAEATSVAFSSDFTLASGFNHGEVRVWYAEWVQDTD